MGNAVSEYSHRDFIKIAGTTVICLSIGKLSPISSKAGIPKAAGRPGRLWRSWVCAMWLTSLKSIRSWERDKYGQTA